MIKVTIIGTGNVSHHLHKAFSHTKTVRVIQVLDSRNDVRTQSFKKSNKKGSDEEKKEQTDIYILAVSDDAIKNISENFIHTDKLVVHTSGSVPLAILPKEIRKGVFYPLQTFSKDREIDFKSVPICVEASHQEDFELLKELGESISNSVYSISSEQRKSLHLAAVFVNNFTNHLYQIGSELCEKHQVPFEVLKPLIAETAIKISSLSPLDAQTGPARRNDQTTLEKQQNQLENESHKKIYLALSEAILKTYGKEL